MFCGLNWWKSRHYVLDHLLCWFGLHFFIKEWLKKTQCVSYFTYIGLICFTILPVHKSENMCLLSYCVDLGYIWSLKSNLCRQTVLAISQRFIIVVSQFYQWINQTLCLEHTFIVLANLHVMIDVPSIDFFTLYNKELIQYMISLDGKVVLAYCSMPGTESDFYLLMFVF